MSTEWPDSWCEAAYRWTHTVYSQWIAPEVHDGIECTPMKLCPRCRGQKTFVFSDQWKAACVLAVLPGLQGPREGRSLPLGLSSRAYAVKGGCDLKCPLGCSVAEDDTTTCVSLRGTGLYARELDQFNLHAMWGGSEHEFRDDLARVVRREMVPVKRNAWHFVQDLAEQDFGRNFRCDEVVHLYSLDAHPPQKTTWIHPRIYAEIKHLFSTQQHEWTAKHSLECLEWIRPAVVWWKRGEPWQAKLLYGVWSQTEGKRLTAWQELCSRGASLRPNEYVM